MTERVKPTMTGIAEAAHAHRSSRRIRRNVKVSGRRTSVSLEIAVWDALAEICGREQIPLDLLCDAVEGRRGGASLASALRIFSLVYFRVLEGRLNPARADKGLAESKPQLGFPSLLESALDRFDAGRRASPSSAGNGAAEPAD